MKVRENKETVELSATIDGYTQIPVYNYVKPDVYDDVAWQSCHYAAGNRNYKYYNETSYIEYSPYVL